MATLKSPKAKGLATGSDVPNFGSLEEERAYWEARGPLSDDVAQPKPGRATAKEKRDSFLNVRLTGEELTRLRDIAARKGLGPSTYARTLVIAAITEDAEAARRAASRAS